MIAAMGQKAGFAGEYYGIQALRAFAALAVVAVHSPRPSPWFHGQAGVDIFFVISGFVMMISSTRLLLKENPARLFLWRRILRIVPLYWLLTGLRLAMITIKPSISVHAKPSTWNIISSFLFIPSMTPDGPDHPLIIVGWTLNFEMLFYLLFAIALTLVHSRKAIEKRGGTLLFLVPAIGLIALLGLLRTDAWPAWTALANPIVLEFLAGVMLARLTMMGSLPKPWLATIMVGLGLLGFLLLVPDTPEASSRVLFWGIPAILVVYGAISLEGILRPHIPQWLLLLGSASYAIYLIQGFIFPVIHTMSGLFFGRMVQESPSQAGWIMLAISLVLVAAAGVAVHLLIERRMTDYLKQLFGRERISPVAL